MFAAILCGGPSFFSTWMMARHREYDTWIGVNHVAAFIEVDWNASADKDTYREVAMMPPRAGICGMQETVDLYREDPATLRLQGGLQTVSWDELPWTMEQGGIGWSAVAAILLAEHLGCRGAHIYGMDLDGDGHLFGDTKTGGQTRWTRERATLRLLRQQTDQRGFKWSRITEGGTLTNDI